MAITHKQSETITASSGTATATILGLSGLLKQIYVEAATSTTTFDVKLTDIYSLDVYHVTGITGKINETKDWPVYGNYTLTIENASVDEGFTYLINILEKL